MQNSIGKCKIPLENAKISLENAKIPLENAKFHWKMQNPIGKCKIPLVNAQTTPLQNITQKNKKTSLPTAGRRVKGARVLAGVGSAHGLNVLRFYV